MKKPPPRANRYSYKWVWELYRAAEDDRPPNPDAMKWLAGILGPILVNEGHPGRAVFGLSTRGPGRFRNEIKCINIRNFVDLAVLYGHSPGTAQSMAADKFGYATERTIRKKLKTTPYAWRLDERSSDPSRIEHLEEFVLPEDRPTKPR